MNRACGERLRVERLSEQKRVQATLRESQERLQATYEATGDFVILLDRQHRMLMVNRFLPKPYDVNTLAVAVAGVLD